MSENSIYVWYGMVHVIVPHGAKELQNVPVKEWNNMGYHHDMTWMTCNIRLHKGEKGVGSSVGLKIQKGEHCLKSMRLEVCLRIQLTQNETERTRIDCLLGKDYCD